MEDQKKLPSTTTIKVDDRGSFLPQNIEEAFRVANAFHKSGLLPARFTSAEMVLTAMQFVLELGLKPLTAMRQLAVVQGTPTIFGDLPLSLCYASSYLESIREYVIAKDGKEICVANGNLNEAAWGAVTIVKRRGDPNILESFFTMDDAEKAGLIKSPTWQKYPKRMLRYRARSQALKDKFPDALNGISILEYDFNQTEDSIPADGRTVSESGAPVKSSTNAAANAAAALKAKGTIEQTKPAVDPKGIFASTEDPKKPPKTLAQIEIEVMDIVKHLGMTDRQLRDVCLDTTGKDPAQMDIGDASMVLAALENRARG